MKILFSYPTKVDDEVALINELMTSGKYDLFHLRKPNWNSDEVINLLSELSEDVRRKTVIHKHNDLVGKFELKGVHLKMNELTTNNCQLSTSCHSYEEVDNLEKNFCHPEFIEGKEIRAIDYCFLSPIYDSISKQGYEAKFDKKELRVFLKKERKIKVIALGGITEGNYSEVLQLGFDGAAFLGSVWDSLLEEGVSVRDGRCL